MTRKKRGSSGHSVLALKKKTKTVMRHGLGFNIREKRRALGMTQEELAKKCKIGREQICNIESRYLPSLETFFLICRALETTPNELLEWED